MFIGSCSPEIYPILERVRYKIPILSSEKLEILRAQMDRILKNSEGSPDPAVSYKKMSVRA